MDALIAALLQWNSLLPMLLSIEDGGKKALAEIKAALAAHGIEADTSQLDAVITDAIARKAKEDALLDPPPAA